MEMKAEACDKTRGEGVSVTKVQEMGQFCSTAQHSAADLPLMAVHKCTINPLTDKQNTHHAPAPLCLGVA